MKFTDFKGDPISMSLWKNMVITFYFAIYSVWYYRRNRITTGRIGNRIEICKGAWGNYYHVRLVEVIRTVKF